MGKAARSAKRPRPVKYLVPPLPAEAHPGPVFADLHGRQPVRILAEGTDLVAYGFGKQRISIPARSISQLIIADGYRDVFGTRSAMILLDQDRRVLLLAPGMWGRELNRIRLAMGLPRPVVSDLPASAWSRAPGYHKLRIRPRVFPVAAGALVVVGLGLAGLGAFAAMLPALTWLASVSWAQGLAGLAGAAAGGVAGAWLAVLCGRAALTIARWTVVTWSVRTPPPISRFVPPPVQAERRLRTAVTVLSVPLLTCWGPVMAGVTLAHGSASAWNLAFAALATAALPLVTLRAIRHARAQRRNHRPL